jgi:hypothetical protein
MATSSKPPHKAVGEALSPRRGCFLPPRRESWRRQADLCFFPYFFTCATICASRSDTASLLSALAIDDQVALRLEVRSQWPGTSY